MGGRRVWLVATVVISTFGLPAVALGENPFLEEGLGAFKALDYPQALELLQRSLGEENLTDVQAIEASRMIAVVHMAYGRTAEAEAAFFELLRFDAGYQLPGNASPELRKVFKGARRRFKRDKPSPRGAGAEAAAGLGTLGSAPVLDDLGAKVEAEHLAAPPPVPPSPSVTEPDALAALEPSWADTPATTEPAVYTTWWFWTIIGGVVVVSAAAATTAVVLTQPPSAEYGPFTLGSP